VPSTVRLDASITGPALEALRAGSTEERVPQWQAGQGGQSRNAYAPTAPRPASTSQLGGVVAALAAVVAVVALGFVAVRVLRAPSATVAVPVLRETVVVVVTATPAPVVAPPQPSFPSTGTRPQSAPVVQAPRAAVQAPAPPVYQASRTQQVYVAPTVGYQDVQGGDAAVGYYQCAEQGVGVTNMDRATGRIKANGNGTMWLSNDDGGPLTPPSYRMLTGCR